jgi:formylglycine-generating enzyme required for sulfatase activity
MRRRCGVIISCHRWGKWTGTVYQAYPYDPTDGREDSSSPADKRFVIRGIGWRFLQINLYPSFREDRPPPDARYYSLGFRPARHRR